MKENATINFTGNTEAISFNCHNFNVCTPSLREIADIQRLHQEGLKPSQIARELGIGVASVYRYREESKRVA